MLTVASFTCSIAGRQICVGERLQVAPGRISLLLGASGGGKTRLLKGIAGLTAELKGELRWQNEQLQDPLYSVIQLGMLFQNNALLDGLTVEENLLLVEGADSQQVVAGLELLGVSSTLEMYPGELSEGMKRRVAFLRAGLGEPELILLDEPLAGLDATARGQVVSMISGWQREGRCLLLSTHLLAGLDELKGCYYVISDGRVQGEYDSLNEVRTAQPQLLREQHEI